MLEASRTTRALACAGGLVAATAAPALALTDTTTTAATRTPDVAAAVTPVMQATALDLLVEGRGLQLVEGPRVRHHRHVRPRRARITALGHAIAPAGAPRAVRQIIEAGNHIATTPYVWGGGHGSWKAAGYDCSGSVGYALHGAKLLKAAVTSGALTSYGRPGKGHWVTIYANGGHVYMVVAGLRFDTSAHGVHGSRWTRELRGGGGYVVRHPAGL